MAAPDNEARARAYTVQPRDQAVKDDPSLTRAYATEDRLKAVAAEAKPVTPSVQLTVDQMIRNTVAASIRRGNEPTSTPQAEESVRFQVAYRSMNYVLGDALQNGAKARTELSDEHRARLVAQAEKAIGAPDPRGNGSVLAREIAGSLAVLDHPNSRNPFKTEALVETYDKAMKERSTSLAAARDRDRDRGGR